MLPDDGTCGHRPQPLGVPSRMNLGQIYETVRMAGQNQVFNSAPDFDGASNEEICDYTDKAGLLRYGKTRPVMAVPVTVDQSATVGIIYMIKLDHMVEDRCMPVLSARTHYYPTASRRQGPIRRPALRRNGGMGFGGLAQ